jgi:hypothetical protein
MLPGLTYLLTLQEDTDKFVQFIGQEGVVQVTCVARWGISAPRNALQNM